MITEWTDNRTLDKYLAENKSISWDRKMKMAIRLAKAVYMCHSKLILHHDIRRHGEHIRYIIANSVILRVMNYVFIYFWFSFQIL